MNTEEVRRALLVVDVQNDFCEGGSLPVTGGHGVASAISSHLASHAHEYAAVVASRDWHHRDDSNGGHFAAAGHDPDYTDTWPAHCVADTVGAAYPAELATRHLTAEVRKGQGAPAYSAFEGVDRDDRTLSEILRAAHVGSVDVVGLATDYCVRATCLDAVDAGLRVRLLVDLTAGVAAETTDQALAELAAAGVELRGRS